ncbi:MAG TPA: multidrug ABC transporter ATP-binding protein, partial [Clostridiales bacterium]|nr:multidrug ABC transporter ATP-binding protein [Clostridiales bacterium]
MARNRYDIDEKLDAPFNFTQFKNLLGFSRPYFRPLSQTLVAMVVASALNLLSPLILMTAINR